jgi:CCR4-NOT complex subunit CAF16
MSTHDATSCAKPLPTIPPYDESKAISITDLTFSYEEKTLPPTLRNLNLTLPKGSRCLLLGANGSGKSTLLRLISGRHLAKPEGCIMVLGLNASRDTRLNFHRSYLGCDGVHLMVDIPVTSMMGKLQHAYPERRDELMVILGINPEWRMHQLSDCQRRRVQLLIQLVRPFNILLLDDVTKDLDVCVRQDLLRWLEKESIDRGATIVYATHIFDGLDDWASHLFYITNSGSCGWRGEMRELDLYQKLKAENHPAKMLAIADHWLRKELEENRTKQ